MNKILFKIRELNWKRNYAVKYFRFWFSYTLSNTLSSLSKRPLPSPNAQIKKILLIRNDLIGDMVVTSGLIRNLAQAGYEVYVSSRKSSLEIIKYNPYVTGVFEYDDKNWKAFSQCLKNIGQHKFDLAFECRSNIGISIYTALFYNSIKSGILIGINKKGIRAFNANIDYEIDKLHVTEKLALLPRYLNIPNPDMSYDLFTNEDIENTITPQLPKRAYAVINPFGSKKPRHFTPQQIETISNRLNKSGYDVILIGEPNQVSTLNIPNTRVINTRQILDIIPIIRNADLVITVDTSIVHMASAFKKNELVFYLYDKANQLRHSEPAEYDIAAQTKQKIMEQCNLAKLRLELGENNPFK